jgi:hypothetical protein
MVLTVAVSSISIMPETIKEGFVHDNLQSGVIKLFYIPTNNNLTNFLTKAVPVVKLT